jgi:4-hydroxy-tetrahydrodipicolinate synthase
MTNSNDITLWTALITPMQPSGEIDFASMTTLLRRQERAGNGIVLLGSTGEGLALSNEEKRQVIDHALTLNLDVPIMAGVSGFDLNATKDWLEFCEGRNVDAYLMPVPLYSKPGRRGQYEWFRSLIEMTERPVMLYNVPSRTGIQLFPEVLQDLDELENLWAVKEASGSAEQFEIYSKANPRLRYFSGDDELLPEFSRLGASGLVSVAGNIWPVATARYVQASLDNNNTIDLEPWQKISSVLFQASNPVPTKALLHQKNLISHSTVRLPLSLDDLDTLDDVVSADHSAQAWLAQYNEEEI